MTPSQVAALFEGPVGVGIADPRHPSGFLYPEEAAHIANAVPKRRAEFQAGRTAARAALTAIGGPASALPADMDRAPIWPKGYAGSITHCEDLCLAVATRAARSVGLDIEPATELARDLWEVVLLPIEQQEAEAATHPGQFAKLIFSAKEAVYKAQFPLSRTLFDFHGLQISCDPSGQFLARFRLTAGEFRPDHRLSGRFQIDSDYIVTTALIG